MPQLPDPMTRLRAPKVAEKLVPVFTSEELSALKKTCQGGSFAQRRDAAIRCYAATAPAPAAPAPGAPTTAS